MLLLIIRQPWLNYRDVQPVCASIAMQNDRSTGTTNHGHQIKGIAFLTIFATTNILFLNFLMIFLEKIVIVKI